MNFSDALNFIKDGVRAERAGWNGKGMWIALVSGNEYNITVWENEGATENLPFIMMKTADDKFVPWLASQTDILAEDWAKVELKD